MQQKRLVIALLISTAILFLWSYLVPVKPPETPQPAPQAQQSPTAAPTAPPSNAATPTTGAVVSTSAPVSAVPRRTVSIKTPLYEVKLDSEGAAAVSWVIKKNKDSG